MQSVSRIMKMFFIFLLMLSAGCASDRPPTGGAVDTAPLRVVSSSPAPSSVNAVTDTIHLTFSHFISARQLIDALRFSPSIGDFDLAVQGKDVIIRVLNPLKNNCTYVVTLDKHLRDNRGRTFPGPYSFAFSTGPVLDTGKISGKVLNLDYSPATNALLLAFSDRHEPDGSENLLKRETEYIVQANASGVFAFNNIKQGSYKIIALNDRNSNLNFDYKTEEAGVSCKSLVAAGTSDLMIRLNGVHTDTDGIVSCTPLEQQLLALKFARSLNITSFNPAKLEIRHAVSGDLIPVVTWFSRNRSLYDSDYVVVTDKLQPNQPYLIRYSDHDGKETMRAIPFFSSSRPTGNRPVSVTITPDNKSEPAFLDSSWPSLGKVVLVKFSVPVDEAEVNRAVTLAETVNGKQESLIFSLHKLDPRTFALKPANGFQPGRYYTLTVIKAAITGFTSLTDQSKPVVSQFRTAEKKDTGSISGKGHASAKHVVIEAKASGSASSFSTTVSCDKNGIFRYTFSELPPGSYTVSAFSPFGDKPPAPYRQWNPGSVKPYKPAEPFGLYAEPVTVRAGWTTENIDIHIILSR